MAKRAELIIVTCPCCQAELHIDPETSAVIRHKEHVKPPSIADFETAVQRMKGEAGRREDMFKKSVEAAQEPSRRAEQEVRRDAEGGQGESGRAAAQAGYRFRLG